LCKYYAIQRIERVFRLAEKTTGAPQYSTPWGVNTTVGLFGTFTACLKYKLKYICNNAKKHPAEMGSFVFLSGRMNGENIG